MFHVQHSKQRRLTLAFIAGVFLLATLSLACSPGVSTHGWAEPVRNGDTLLVSTGKGRIDGIDVSSRDRLWRFPNDWSIADGSARKFKGIYGPPIIVETDGRDYVVVGDYNGYLYAFLDPGQGAISSDNEPPAGSLKLGAPIIGGIALDSATNTLFVTAGDTLYRIDALELIRRIDGRDAPVQRKWTFKTGGDIWTTPVLQGGNVYVGSLDGSLYAVNQSNGEQAWHFDTPRGLVASPIIAGSTILIGGFDYKLYAVDATTGELKWDFKGSNWIWTRPLVEGSRVYVGDFDGKVHALNLSDGSVVWSAQVADNPIRASLALAQGVLVVASEDGHIYGIDPSTQQSKWDSRVLTSLNANLVSDSSTVYIAPKGCVTPEGEDSKVYYLSVDATSGNLRRTGGVC